MKSTGVLRRIDDLGRIVIPKGIRKSLKIRDGESLEIFINGDAIVLKKYSYMSDLGDIAQTCADSIYDVINEDIIITDRDKIIAISGSMKKKYNEKNISKQIEEFLDKRKIVIEKEKQELSIIDKEVLETQYIISPVIANGDVVGLVIILSDKNFNGFEEKSAIFISKFLGKHLE